MSANKTKATVATADAYIAGIGDEYRRRDCEQLVALMSKATKRNPVMWGEFIVGFGIHKYPLAGGKQGEICAVGFSSRKSDISIYGVAGASGSTDLLDKLGKHKLGKGCLYVNRLSDIDLKILENLVSLAFKAKHA
jgi:hypothetical protein